MFAFRGRDQANHRLPPGAVRLRIYRAGSGGGSADDMRVAGPSRGIQIDGVVGHPALPVQDGSSRGFLDAVSVSGGLEVADLEAGRGILVRKL
jgi:hypothetical protein